MSEPANKTENANAGSIHRMVIRRPRFFIRLKPLKNCQHGFKDLKWWQLRWVKLHLSWVNYGTHYMGTRLWLYTKWGAWHFDVYHVESYNIKLTCAADKPR